MADTPERATAEFLEAIRCVIYFAPDEHGDGEVEAVGFSRGDGLVRFGVNWGPFWRGERGMEVEAVLCS